MANSKDEFLITIGVDTSVDHNTPYAGNAGSGLTQEDFPASEPADNITTNPMIEKVEDFTAAGAIILGLDTESGGKDDWITFSSYPGNVTHLGNKTLFVNAAETQRLVYGMGLPPFAPGYRQITYNDILSKLGNDANNIIQKTDLVRFNLGKFFYRRDGVEETFEFIDKKMMLSSLDTPVQSDMYMGMFKHVVEFQFTNTHEIIEDLDNLIFYDGSKLKVWLSRHNKSYLNGGWNDQNENIANKLDEWIGFLHRDLPVGIANSVKAGSQGLGFGKSDARNIALNPGALKPLTFADHAFLYSSPAASTQDAIIGAKVLFANAASNYNFFQETYELSTAEIASDYVSPNSAIFNVSGPSFELYLPNFNVLLAEKNNSINAAEIDNLDNLSVDKNYAIHTTLNNRLPANILRPLATTENDYDETNGTSGNEYLSSWGDKLLKDAINIVEDSKLKSVVNKFQHIIFPLEAVKNKDANILKESFPYYNEITFNTDTNTRIANILRDSNLFLPLVMDYISLRTSDKSEIPTMAFKGYEESLRLLGDDLPAGSLLTLPSIASPTVDPRVYDFDQRFARKIDNLSNDSLLMTNIQNVQDRIISMTSEEFADDQVEFLQMNPLIKLIYKVMFKTLYADFVKKNKRTYQDIISGRTCYNETLFYRIEKSDADGNIIQNFYVLNDSELDVANLIDTQILYGKKYSYQFYAVQFVLGNRYDYQLLQDQVTNEWSKVFNYGEALIANINNAVLLEVPYAGERTVQVRQLPPVPPNVNFIPYRNIDNKIMISLMPNIDEYYDNYISIAPEDFTKITNSSESSISSTLTHFRSEGDITDFELFQISELDFPDGPLIYTDFGMPGKSKKIVLSMLGGSPSYVDTILPNTKYWYIFRTLDRKHPEGLNAEILTDAPNFSNPTEIYEIELVNNDGAIYFVMNTYSMDHFLKLAKERRKQPKISFNRFMTLAPTLPQSQINIDPDFGGLDYDNEEIISSIKDYIESMNDDTTSIALGIKEKSVFGDVGTADADTNVFKVRITSRKTGRKIDVHLRFKKPILQK